MPGALRFEPAVLNMKGADGLFTGVEGQVTAIFDVPEGYTLDGEVKLQTPLTAELFPAVTARMADKKLIATFDNALIDNNIPAGNAVPLTVSANFIHSGVQTKLSSTANVRVMK
jgi:hypothetical protein